MTRLLLLLFSIIPTVVSLVIYAEKVVVYDHLVADFGVAYGSNVYTGPIVDVEPFDNCSSLVTDVSGKIGLIMETNDSNCTVARQVFELNEHDAMGVVVISNHCDEYADSLYFLSDSESELYEYTIPVITISCASGVSILDTIANYPSTNATISYAGEVNAFSAVEYVILTIVVLISLWGGLGCIYILNRCSDLALDHQKKKVVKQIKKRRFKRKSLKNVEENPVCSICLCDFEENEAIKKLRCGHYFHAKCIDPWLLNEKAICPICRQGIFKEEEWNALAEGIRRDIDIAFTELEQQSTCNVSNLFSLVVCLFIVGCPFILSVL